jgi:hypothetical protein
MHPSLVKVLKRIGACGKSKGPNGPNDLSPHVPDHLLRRKGAGFGEAERNALVELAAVNAVNSDYQSRGWQVKSKESERVGYDLLCRYDSAVHHVEVKGISGPSCSFLITVKEKKESPTGSYVPTYRRDERPGSWQAQAVAVHGAGTPSQVSFFAAQLYGQAALGWPQRPAKNSE